MYRSKNKLAFFAIHQALTKFNEFDIEFHILWDDIEYRDEWTDKIESLDCKLISYDKNLLDDYCLKSGITQEFINNFSKFKAVYFIIHAHYLRHVCGFDYYLIYDDDIVLGDELSELIACLKNKIPCLIHEPMNAGCDKVMASTLFNLYQGGYEYYRSINPQFLGFNAGFQGISLEMYDDFKSPEMFDYLLHMFNYRGIFDENGKEIKMTPQERGAIDTQQQSFFSLMNIIRSTKKPHILNPMEYFVCANWGYHPIYGELNPTNSFDGWDINMKSKVVHFIGHTVLDGVYYGKPKVYHKLVDEYLQKYNIK